MTRRDFKMNWDQIEHRWAAMTRRVRADWTIQRPEAPPKVPHRSTRPDESPVVLGDRTSGFDGPEPQKTLNE